MPMGVGIGGLGGGGMRLGQARPKKWGELGVGGKSEFLLTLCPEFSIGDL
jgi:hypothetical protein